VKGQESEKPKPKAKTKRARAGGPRTYMGRPIAPVMTFEGAEWLVRPEREQEEQPEAMLDALKIKPGDTVADVGAGWDTPACESPDAWDPRGKYWRPTFKPEMLRMLAANMKAAGVKNVRALRCTATDTNLPDDAVDLALMVDVYHESSDPEALLQGLRRALRPGGRLVLVEFRGEDPDVPIKPEHKMTFAQVRREVEPQGFRFKQKFDFLPWQHIIIFEKPTEKTKSEPEKKVD